MTDLIVILGSALAVLYFLGAEPSPSAMAPPGKQGINNNNNNRKGKGQ